MKSNGLQCVGQLYPVLTARVIPPGSSSFTSEHAPSVPLLRSQ
eukprot:COSAG06_NODE_6253_length_3012_cov_3.331617_3_plen_43_part_00